MNPLDATGIAALFVLKKLKEVLIVNSLLTKA
jgi:hypothetical protein